MSDEYSQPARLLAELNAKIDAYTSEVVIYREPDRKRRLEILELNHQAKQLLKQIFE